jgi:RimJ/RimL family protein N-acetyltransferase
MSNSETEEFLQAGLQNPTVTSWGVIDKNNITGYHHPAPLVGFISFEVGSPYNGYFHVASPRSAWGKGLIEEAGYEAINWIFNNSQVTRVSAAILDKNRAAKSLCYRLGFKRDGLFEDFVIQNGQPLAVAHFGLTRTAWSEQQENPCQVSQKPSSQSLPTSSQESAPLLVQDLEQPSVELEPVETKVE